MKPVRKDDRFSSAVRKQVERSKSSQRPNLWSAASVVGTVGWMVVLPALLGVALGRLLDSHFNAGIFWTLSLLTVGLVVGCVAAWHHIEEVINE